jgi:hypothetical protein
VTVELGVSADRREPRAFDAVAFLVAAAPGVMVTATLALCTVVSRLRRRVRRLRVPARARGLGRTRG